MLKGDNLLAGLILLLGGTAAFFLTMNDDEAVDDAPADVIIGEEEGSSTTDASPASDEEDDDERGGATTTAPQDADRLVLPSADPANPSVEPSGTYHNGKVVLTGSAPTAEVAAGYARKASSVLGEENVTMAMTLDSRVEGTTMTIDVDQQFRFPSGAITFDPEFEALLNLGAAALQLLPEANLVVTGHTDDIGEEATNIALGQARAQVVVNWMVGHGIAPDRVIVRSAGESEPIADNATPEGRDANRRIEAVLEGITPG